MSKRIFLTCFLATFVVLPACKKSSKSNPPPAETDVNNPLNGVNDPNQTGNALGITVTANGQSSGSTIQLAAGQINLAFNIQAATSSLQAALSTAPTGLTLNNVDSVTPTLTGSLPDGTQQITLVVRDLTKCQQLATGNCQLPIDNLGRLSAQTQLDSNYDAQFNFTLQVGTVNGTTNTGGFPGFGNSGNNGVNNTADGGFLSQAWDSVKGVGTFMWDGVKRLLGIQ